MGTRRGLLALFLSLLLLLGSPLASRMGSSSTVHIQHAEPAMTLSLEELTRIKIFAEARPSVVFVSGLQGGATGWVFDGDNHVVTSLRAVEGEPHGSIRVRFADHTMAPARIVGVDRGSDLAVLEVRRDPGIGESARPLRRGTSADLCVGQDIYAVGDSGGLDHTLSRGIVCGLGQSFVLRGDHPVQGAIHVDAAIHDGNSGGPLLNSRGEVIAMSVAAAQQPGGLTGVGVAVPIDSVTVRVQSILKHGHVRRPALGVFLGPNGLAEQLGVRTGGVVVVEVPPGSARDAGARMGDVVVAVDGKPVSCLDDVVSALDLHEPGESARLTVLRPVDRKAADELRPNVRRTEVDLVIFLEASNT